jgi:hypothetical protein
MVAYVGGGLGSASDEEGDGVNIFAVIFGVGGVVCALVVW